VRGDAARHGACETLALAAPNGSKARFQPGGFAYSDAYPYYGYGYPYDSRYYSDGVRFY